jgi:hypothetical protein
MTKEQKFYNALKDVILFWKTHMLYYVKTDRLFKNLEVEIETQSSKVKSVVFEDDEEIDIENLDYKLIKPLIWW